MGDIKPVGSPVVYTQYTRYPSHMDPAKLACEMCVLFYRTDDPDDTDVISSLPDKVTPAMVRMAIHCLHSQLRIMETAGVETAGQIGDLMNDGDSSVN